MDMQTVMKSLEEASKDKKVKFISDKGKNSCDKCLQYDGKIFNVDDPNLPQLPIHPNCRCKYVAVENPDNDVSKDVEQHRIAQALKKTYKLQEEDAKSLAEQVTKARDENEKLREQKLFLLFNGRYLMSSDGKLLLDAVSGKAVSIDKKSQRGFLSDIINETITAKFDNSYERQGIIGEGALPQGLYSISCKESGSLANGNINKHLLKMSAWGDYHWQLVPDENTDTRERQRNSFTIHGGDIPGSAGCIDLTSNDTKFRKYLQSLNVKNIYVYAQYDQDDVTVKQEKTKYSPLVPRII